MGTAPIKDVMLSFNTASVDSPAKQDNKGGMFMDVLNGAVAKTGQNAANLSDASAVKQADVKSMGVRKAQTAESKGIKNDSDDMDTGSVKDKRPGTEDLNKAGKAITEKTARVMEAIKDELAISDEELETAMANLGLSPLDLFDIGNLKDLMLELAGEDDALALVTNGELLASINSVTDLMQSAVDELSEEFGVTGEEINSIIETMKADGQAVGAQTGELSADRDEEADEETPGADVFRVDAGRRDADEAPVIRQATPESVEMQRRVSRMMDERNQDGQMHEAMPGQSFVENLQGDQAAVVTPTGEGVNPYVDRASILEQVTDQIRVDITEDSTTMELRLHPASLGTVNLTVASNGGVVTANILVQNEAVKAVLEGQLTQLLQTFEEQGQKVEAIEVAVAGYDLDRSLNQGNDRGNEGSQERRSDGIARTGRRRLNLNELTEEDIEELSEEEQLAAEMMDANGTSVDYMA